MTFFTAVTDLSTVSPVEEVIVEIDSGNLSYALVHWDYSVDNSGVTGVVAFWCSSSTRLPDVVKCKVCLNFQICLKEVCACVYLKSCTYFKNITKLN